MTQIEIARRWREALAGEEHLPYVTIERYVDRLLDTEQHAAAEAHLELCAACVDEVEDLSAFIDEMRVPRLAAHRRKTLWYTAAGLAAAAMLILVIGLGRMNRPQRQPAATIAETTLRSMAVLPLRNMMASAENDFLSVAIADALATRLEERSDLAVRPMASILPIRNQTSDIRQVAKKLNVDGVIEGQFSAGADDVHVTVQLTDSRTGRAVWQESIRGQRGDLLKLVDDVTARTEWRLNRVSRASYDRPAGSQARSSNPKAYEEFLKARALYGSFRPQDFAARTVSLERAIELDPNFAAAHADLALNISLGIVRSLAGGPDVLDRAERHAAEAVRLDPSLSEAHLALGRVLARRQERFREAVREIMAALRLKPTNTSALQAMLSYFAYYGEADKMRCVGQRIIAIDPLSEEAKTRGYWFNKTLDSESALRAAPFAFADPTSALAGHDIRGEALLLQGKIDLAEKEAAAALKLDPDRYHAKSLFAMAAAARGNRALAESWLAKFEADTKQNHFAAVRAMFCYAKLGDTAAALDRMDTAIALGNHGWYLFLNHPWLPSLRSEPRFQANLAKIKGDLDAVYRDVIAVYPFVAEESCAGAGDDPSQVKVALSSVRAAP